MKNTNYKFSLIRGYGNRKNRVHIFDREYGYFICSGYIRDGVVYTNKAIIQSVIVRKFEGRTKHADSGNLQEVPETHNLKEA